MADTTVQSNDIKSTRCLQPLTRGHPVVRIALGWQVHLAPAVIDGPKPVAQLDAQLAGAARLACIVPRGRACGQRGRWGEAALDGVVDDGAGA